MLLRTPTGLIWFRDIAIGTCRKAPGDPGSPPQSAICFCWFQVDMYKAHTNLIGVVKRQRYQGQIEKVQRCLSYISMTVFIFNIIEEAQEAIPSCPLLACVCKILTGWELTDTEKVHSQNPILQGHKIQVQSLHNRPNAPIRSKHFPVRALQLVPGTVSFHKGQA